MHNQNMKKLASIIAALTITATNVVAGDFNAAIGNFDYSDKGKSAAMLELTYGFTEKNIDTKIGTIQPIAGAFFTADSAGMAYFGAKIDY